MMVITGANGTLGRAVTERLLDTVPAQEVGVSVRDPEQAAALAERGVRVRRGDFADSLSVQHAFEGAAQVLVVSAGALGDTAVRLNRTAITAAAQAVAASGAGATAAAQAVAASGAGGRVLYTSHMAASPESLFPPMPTHAASEQALRESGVAFTSLRNGFYTSTVLRLLAGTLETGELALPEDGPVSWTSHADLAVAAVHALLGQDLDGITPALTATDAIDMATVAEIASEVLGRPVRRTTVSDEDYRAGLVAGGAPQAAADLMVGMFRASRRGEFAAVDPTLSRLLGRPPDPVRDVLRAALAPQTGTP